MENDRVTYVHQLRDANGYGYVYTKVVRLSKDTLFSSIA